MTPGKYDLSLYRGDTYKWTFQLWANKEKTAAVDLTDATVAAEFRDAPGGTSIVTLACEILPVVPPATLPNIVEVQMTKLMWDDAPLGGAWDLEVTFPDGRVRTVVAGDVEVTPDVTNSGQAGLLAVTTTVEEGANKRPVSLRQRSA